MLKWLKFYWDLEKTSPWPRYKIPLVFYILLVLLGLVTGNFKQMFAISTVFFILIVLGDQIITRISRFSGNSNWLKYLPLNEKQLFFYPLVFNFLKLTLATIFALSIIFLVGLFFNHDSSLTVGDTLSQFFIQVFSPDNSFIFGLFIMVIFATSIPLNLHEIQQRKYQRQYIIRGVVIPEIFVILAFSVIFSAWLVLTPKLFNTPIIITLGVCIYIFRSHQGYPLSKDFRIKLFSSASLLFLLSSVGVYQYSYSFSRSKNPIMAIEGIKSLEELTPKEHIEALITSLSENAGLPLQDHVRRELKKFIKKMARSKETYLKNLLKEIEFAQFARIYADGQAWSLYDTFYDADLTILDWSLLAKKLQRGDKGGGAALGVALANNPRVKPNELVLEFIDSNDRNLQYAALVFARYPRNKVLTREKILSKLGTYTDRLNLQAKYTAELLEKQSSKTGRSMSSVQSELSHCKDWRKTIDKLTRPQLNECIRSWVTPNKAIYLETRLGGRISHTNLPALGIY